MRGCSEPRRTDWLFGPAVDLLLGCGLGYAALVLFLLFYQPQMARLGPWLPLLILVTGVPHYGATLLRISATPEDRRRFARPALLLGVVVLCGLIAGLRMPRFGAALITLYLSLSPWHYAAQNYGITMLFLRRRGVQVDAGSRRLLRMSFVASYLLVLLSYHQLGAGRGNDPLYAASGAFRFLSLGLPSGLSRIFAVVLLALYLVPLAFSIRSFWRQQSSRSLAPVLAVLGSQCLWFSLPAIMSLFAPGRYSGQHVALAFVWIAIGHSVQYIWIAVYYHRAARARRSTTAKGGPDLVYLLRALLFGAALWVLPALVFAPGALGHVSFDAGLGLLVAAAVNLHHFALDGMIWRLRDPRIAGLLAGSAAQQLSEYRRSPFERIGQARPPTLAACALIAGGGLSIFVWVATAWEAEIGFRRAYAARDLSRLERASQRLTALGRDGAPIHLALGRLKLRKGQAAAAIPELRRSLELLPTRAAWMELGRAHQARGELAEAEVAYREALTIDPD